MDAEIWVDRDGDGFVARRVYNRSDDGEEILGRGRTIPESLRDLANAIEASESFKKEPEKWKVVNL